MTHLYPAWGPMMACAWQLGVQVAALSQPSSSLDSSEAEPKRGGDQAPHHAPSRLTCGSRLINSRTLPGRARSFCKDCNFCCRGLGEAAISLAALRCARGDSERSLKRPELGGTYRNRCTSYPHAMLYGLVLRC